MLFCATPFQNGQGCPWFHAEAMFLLQQKLALNSVQGCTLLRKSLKASLSSRESPVIRFDEGTT